MKKKESKEISVAFVLKALKTKKIKQKDCERTMAAPEMKPKLKNG